MKKLMTALFVTAFLAGTVTSSWALWGMASKAEGTVRSISSNMITIDSQAKNGSGADQLNLEVNDKTKLKQLGSLNELKEGDRVQVAYKEDGDRKIAVSVTREGNEGNNSGSQNYNQGDQQNSGASGQQGPGTRTPEGT